VQVKWPNDIYSGGVKIGGALIHTSWQGEGFNVVTGIGLNVSNTHPTTCLNSVLSQQLAQQQQQQAEPAGASCHGGGSEGASQAAAAATSGSDPASSAAVQVCREELLAHICSALEACFTTFEQQGFQALEQEYLRCWMHSGQQVTLVDPPGADGQPGEAVALTITGLSSTGFLRAVDAAGAAYELTPDGNSLDMMQGLLRRKM
jgi:biotin--protein ligase